MFSQSTHPLATKRKPTVRPSGDRTEGAGTTVVLRRRTEQGATLRLVTLAKAEAAGVVDQVVDMAGTCLNTALEAAANEPLPANRVFSPQNWIKTKTCLAGIRAAIQQYFAMLPSMPGGKDLSLKLRTALTMDPG
jgi:hypothetical protein